MEIIFYVLIFIIGAYLGSFYVGAIYKISKEQKVFTLHTYCLNCGNKLGFFEKIPIISYIFLKGKCKHCHKKISKQYLILEILTGILFVAFAFALKLQITNFELPKLISYIFIILYLSYIIIASGLDQKDKNLSPSLLAFGVIISIIYIVYVCVTDKQAVYSSIVQLILMVILLLLNIIITKKRAKSSYTIDLLTTLLIMLIFTQEIACIITIIGTLIAIAFYILINKLNEKRQKAQKSKISFNTNARLVFIMGVLNILSLLTIMIHLNN